MTQYLRPVAAVMAFLCALPLAASLTSTNRQAAFATYQDIEPAITTQMRSSVEHQVTSWMEFTADGTSNPPTKLKYSHFASGNASIGTIPLVTGYTWYADPLLAQNTTSASPAQRIYLVGVGYNRNTGSNPTTQPSAVLRWYSDDGGLNWSSGGVIETVTGTSTAPLFLDKPAIAVSPASSGSSGYVYVVYVRQTGTNTNPQYQLQVEVSTNGGSTWNGPYNVNSASTNFPAAQIMVDTNGDVYVVWLLATGGTDEMRVARATAYNGSMTFTEGTGSMVSAGDTPDGNDYVACGTTCQVRATAVPMAKLDAARDRIGVTWHAENASGGIEINFRTISIATSTPVWQTGITFWNGGNDLQPALDFDTSGNFLVSYYAFPNLNSPTYYNVARYITFSGTTPVIEDANQNVHLLTTTASDVSQYPAFDTAGRRLLGEYHDVSFSNGTFKTVGIQIVTNGNPYVFTTTHN